MFLRLILVALTILLSACASTTDVETRFQDSATKPAIRSLLLVAKTPETRYRHTWETTCNPLFSSLGLQVTNSITALPDWLASDTKSLTDWIHANHLDAILLVDITNLLLAPPQMPGQQEEDPSGILERGSKEDPLGATLWTIPLGRKPVSAPGARPGELSAEVQLLDPAGKLFWNAQLTTHEANDLAAVAASQCKAIRKALQQQGLL